jgi:ABC-type phosphate transport system substrate-binding protein
MSLNRESFKALWLDGIPPTLENVTTRQYPLTQTLAFVLRDDLASPLARDFVAFVRSGAGRRLLERHGYVAVR